MEYAQLFAKDTSYTFEARHLEGVKKTKRVVSTAIPAYDLDTNLEVEFRHFAAIHKILSGGKIKPMVDLLSHQDVFIVCGLANQFGVDVQTAFFNWTDYEEWINLHKPEYMYLLYNISELLVDFKKFFRLANTITSIGSIEKSVFCMKTHGTPDLMIDMLEFYRCFKFEQCFDEFNAATKQLVDRLNSEMAKISRVFLINPHDPFYKDYFRYTPYNGSKWECDKISIFGRPDLGAPTIVSKDVALQRFHEFTCGVFKEIPPIVFAGGSVSSILSPEYDLEKFKAKDVDMFIGGYGLEKYSDKRTMFERTLKHFAKGIVADKKSTRNAPEIYYGVNSSVVSVYPVGVNRKFQIITCNRAAPFDILNRFDLSHIQWMFYEGEFYGLPAAFKAFREKATSFNNTKRLQSNRLVKALYYGFDIVKTEDSVNLIDIGELIKDPSLQNEPLQNVINEFYRYYYPKHDTSVSVEDETRHIKSMVKMDSKALIVTEVLQTVLNNVTIGGDFESDYVAVSCETFNQGIILNRNVGRNVTKLTLKSCNGMIKVLSSILGVARCISGDDGVTITTISEDNFKNFCTRLETEIYPLYRRGGVTQKILDKDGHMVSKFDTYKVEHQARSGRSLLKDQRGAPLNIEEDLKPGDKIKIIFTITIEMLQDSKRVILTPLRCIKMCHHDPENDLKVEEADKKFTAELQELVKEIKYDASVVYDE